MPSHDDPTARDLTSRVRSKIHRAARIDDAVLAWRERRGRKRGRRATVIPYTGYGATTWVRVLGRVVLTKKATTDVERAESIARIRGWRSFITVPIVDAAVTVTIGDEEFPVTADRGGVIDARVEVSLEPGWHTIGLSTEGSPLVTAQVFIIGDNVRTGVISDVDDTVMVTALPRPFVAAWNTFVLDEHARVPVPGMAVFLDRLTRSEPGTPIIYLSTGAWNVAPTLTRFLARNLYPAGALLLTDWGPTVDRFFRSGSDHKRANLARLADEFPQISWILVGDDGQHDEDLYQNFATEHPDRVRAIAIRRLSVSQAVLAGGRAKYEDSPTGEDDSVLRLSAPDGAGLLALVRKAGLL